MEGGEEEEEVNDPTSSHLSLRAAAAAAAAAAAGSPSSSPFPIRGGRGDTKTDKNKTAERGGAREERGWLVAKCRRKTHME